MLTGKSQAVLDGASNTAREVLEKRQDAIGLLKDTVSNFKWSVPIFEEPRSKLSQTDKDRLFFLRAKLEIMASELQDILSFLEKNIDQNRSRNMIVDGNIETIYLHNREFINLEIQLTEIEKDLNTI